jgi:hypothetical protein
VRTIITAVLAAVTLAFGVTGAARAPTTGGQQAAVTGSGQRLPVVYDGVQGWTKGAARPAVIYLDGSNVFLRTPHWSRWSASSAYSAARLWVNTCSPTCSAGHYRRYAAGVTLSRVAVHRSVRYFSRLHLSYWHSGRRDYAFRWATYPGAKIPVWIGGPK